jgi:hypothetical protein
MNVLGPQQWAPQGAFHHQSVFRDLVALPAGHRDPSVTCLIDMPCAALGDEGFRWAGVAVLRQPRSVHSAQ